MSNEIVRRHCEMLGNRLRKRMRHLRRWAAREDIGAWRCYDGEIPEIPLAIDWYDGHLHIVVAEGRGGSRKVEDPDAWVRALEGVAAAAARAHLGWTDASRVFVKRSRRLKRLPEGGREQYERNEADAFEHLVRERGHVFAVDLATYHDTGLFLDHRETRRLVASEVEHRDVLNLFAYTGSFSVYAAKAGARSTTTVDLSRRYLEWAGRNLALNEVESSFEADAKHRLVRDDTFGFLRHSQDRYDVIIADPPTFSASKRSESSFDVQRDHGDLVDECLQVLRPGGTLWFSTNRRKFKLDRWIEDHAELAVVAMTDRTQPQDYSGRAHRVWRIDLR